MKTEQFSGNVDGKGVTHDTLASPLPLVCVEGQRARAVICALFRNKGPARQTQSHYRLEQSPASGGAKAIAAEGGDGHASIAF